ncbi:MAG: hypothetical protein H7Y15_18715 [Pseudonocardia sp.]|nr:hypothetical protein [Pseudonocardia sp.]
MTSLASPAPIRGLTDQTADVDGVRLHYRRDGDPTGPPVLLWHGFLAKQITPLTTAKITVPVTAVGGDQAQGHRIAEMVTRVVADTTAVTIENCGHFIPEQRPRKLVALITDNPDRGRT